MYLDSSVLVKVLLHEPDSLSWRERVGGADSHQSSVVSLVEVSSAVRQKRLLGAISAATAQQLWQRFRRDIETGQLTLLPLTQPVMEEAVRILDSLPDSIPLRSLDALHLASVRVFNATPLATNDSRMITAAKVLGIALV